MFCKSQPTCPSKFRCMASKARKDFDDCACESSAIAPGRLSFLFDARMITLGLRGTALKPGFGSRIILGNDFTAFLMQKPAKTYSPSHSAKDANRGMILIEAFRVGNQGCQIGSRFVKFLTTLGAFVVVNNALGKT